MVSARGVAESQTHFAHIPTHRCVHYICTNIRISPHSFHASLLPSSNHLSSHFLLPSSLESSSAICNNTWGDRLTALMPPRSLKLYIRWVTLHFLHSPSVMGNLFFLKGQSLTSATTGITQHHYRNTGCTVHFVNLFIYMQQDVSDTYVQYTVRENSQSPLI